MKSWSKCIANNKTLHEQLLRDGFPKIAIIDNPEGTTSSFENKLVFWELEQCVSYEYIADFRRINLILSK
ncbi:MAG: hypothetical protein Q6366_007700 [Candidatus Freyarchaeota archaeon]